jgi:cystathionine gamma-synthase
MRLAATIPKLRVILHSSWEIRINVMDGNLLVRNTIRQNAILPLRYHVPVTETPDTFDSDRHFRRPSLGPGDEILSSAGFETLALHAGQDPDPTTGAVIPPIYAVSTYAQDSVANPRDGYVYSRPANPTRKTLESCIAALEGGSVGLAFSSGMAAETAMLHALCVPGDHIIMPNDVYGGTFRLLDKVYSRWNISYTAVPIWNTEAVAQAVRPSTRVIFCETPTNPLLGIADMHAIAEIAHTSEAYFAVDNTFASPYLQQPIQFGADVVVHSATKYLGGHSDLVGGVLVAATDEVGARIRFHQNSMGAVPSAFDAWLLLRGMKTLAVRMDRQCQSAALIVDFLKKHPLINKLYYPGLESHPGHELASRQMTKYGGIVSFSVVGGERTAVEVCNAARLFTLAESLGAVESLISHPVRMTHASAAGSAVAPANDLIRISVGLESAEDLIADLERALKAAEILLNKLPYLTE